MSVDAVQLRLIWLLLAAVVVTLPGAVGGCVSIVVGEVTELLTDGTPPPQAASKIRVQTIRAAFATIELSGTKLRGAARKGNID